LYTSLVELGFANLRVHRSPAAGDHLGGVLEAGVGGVNWKNTAPADQTE